MGRHKRRIAVHRDTTPQPLAATCAETVHFWPARMACLLIGYRTTAWASLRSSSAGVDGLAHPTGKVAGRTSQNTSPCARSTSPTDLCR
jgi:hypothetical protein